MECPSCGTRNPDDAGSCSQCSTSLTETSLPTLITDPDETLPDEMYTEQETLLDTESLPSFGSRYETRRLLGRSGMGAVYLARDLELNRDVALKEIRPELANHPEIGVPAGISRFISSLDVQWRQLMRWGERPPTRVGKI